MARYSKTTGRPIGPGTGNGIGQGDSWGGPAKGASKARKAPDFEPGNAVAAGNHEPKNKDAERAQWLKDHLFTLATTAENEMTQLRASEAWLNRHEGMPIARSITTNVDDVSKLDDAAIEAELARLAAQRGSGSQAAAGDASPRVSAKPNGVLH